MEMGLKNRCSIHTSLRIEDHRREEVFVVPGLVRYSLVVNLRVFGTRIQVLQLS